MKILIQLIIFPVALILIAIFLPISIIFSIFKGNDFATYMYDVNTCFSQFGNVLGQYIWNNTLVKGDYYPYGNPDETISGVTGKNLVKGTLTKTGLAVNAILDKLEKDHSIKSIEVDEAANK